MVTNHNIIGAEPKHFSGARFSGHSTWSFIFPVLSVTFVYHFVNQAVKWWQIGWQMTDKTEVTPIAMTAWWNQFQNQCEVLKLFVRSLRTLCPEPPNKLCEPSRQNMRILRMTPKQPAWDPEAGFFALWSRLRQTWKQAIWDPETGSIASQSRLHQGLKQAPSGSQTGSFFVFFLRFFLVFPFHLSSVTLSVTT